MIGESIPSPPSPPRPRPRKGLEAQHASLPLHYASRCCLVPGNAPVMARSQGQLDSGVNDPPA